MKTAAHGGPLPEVSLKFHQGASFQGNGNCQKNTSPTEAGNWPYLVAVKSPGPGAVLECSRCSVSITEELP